MSFISELLAKVEAETITIGTDVVPVKSLVGLVKALPTVIGDWEKGADVRQIIRDVQPEVLPVVEAIANVVFPGSGNGITFAVMLLGASHNMDADEERAWMDRQGSGEGGN